MNKFMEQPGLYNYDFGFRGYYAPIGRFTSIDPLAEHSLTDRLNNL